MKKKILTRLFISLVLGGFLYLAAKKENLSFTPPAEGMALMQWWAVPSYVGLCIITHILRASRWRLLIAPIRTIPIWDVLMLNWVGFFSIFALPLRLGEMTRPALTKLKYQVTLSAGLGTVAVERVIDGLITSLCLLFGLLALDKPVTVFAWLFVFIFTGGFTVLMAFVFFRHPTIRFMERCLFFFPKKISSVLMDKLGSMADGLATLKNPRLGFQFIIESLLYWGVNALGMWVLALACGIDIGFGPMVSSMGILALALLIPAGPGMFGNFQLGMLEALKTYTSTPTPIASNYIFWLYMTQMAILVIFGIIPLFLMKISFKDMLGTELARNSLRPPGT